MFNFFNKNRQSFFNSRTSNKMIYTLVGFEKAKQMIESQEVILIDVRSKKEYDTMHIINAINISVEEIGEGKINISPECKIMVYCASGTRSKTAISLLNRVGYNNIYIWEYASLATFPYKNMIIYNKNY